MHVIGTAGHVDHGKSTLVLALTGIDPDRLKEEKERQMTIDLGFAWLRLPDGQIVGVVDVPGHIDFIQNMLAGVGGIDAALLVIAADEGVMPQTREHLSILDLLAVPGGLIALTKLDLVNDPEWLDLVQEDICQVIQRTCLAHAPIVPVSARTGQGLDALKATLVEVLAAVPPRRDVGRPRLPIDRVFSLTGFGTIVTGTLSDGSFEVGQEVVIVPGRNGEPIKARIRGLQTYHQKTERALPGSRVAINLTNVHPDELARGMVVTRPGLLTVSTLIDVRLRMLPDAPLPVRHNQEVAFFTGAAEVMARTRLLDAETLQPGSEGWVQLHLAKPVAVLPGDRFILRLPSPSYTLGGGVIVDAMPRRWRRFRPEVIRRLETLAHGSPAEQLLHVLEQVEPITSAELIARCLLPAETALAALQELAQRGAVEALAGGPLRIEQGDQLLISANGWRAWRERLLKALEDYHARYPLRPGIPRQELKGRLETGQLILSTRAFNEIMARAAAEGIVEEEGTLARRAGFRVAFTPEQEQAIRSLLSAFEQQPYTPPSVADAVASVGADVFQALVDQGRLVKVSEDVAFSASVYRQMVAEIRAFIEREGSITVAQARDLLQTSRKYALALMEYLDAQRITRRVGDVRVLREKTGEG
ncbi:MAG: selenocysteine-specific translation elongation factor [Anaerolineae bacterium]|nr:selenocysteine-specific translation elongation factor [Anaerolineae bacterium]MDW8098531.1 selenocysteine-specific translation elongation factor [Anaerolineae bacterium]